MKELLIMAKSLGGGGSEVALIELINALPEELYNITLVLLDSDNEYAYRLKKKVNIVQLTFNCSFAKSLVSMYAFPAKVLKKLSVNSFIPSVILGKIIGLAGIIFATAIARLTTYFWYEPYLLFRNYFGQSCSVYFKGVLKSIVTTLCILAIEYICVGTFHPTGWIFWIAKAIFVCGVSFLCVFALYGKSEGFQIILGKVRKCLPQNMRR